MHSAELVQKKKKEKKEKEEKSQKARLELEGTRQMLSMSCDYYKRVYTEQCW